MGASASVGLRTAVKEASVEELRAAFCGMPAEQHVKLSTACSCDDVSAKYKAMHGWSCAPRPTWLPNSGPSQAQIAPHCWALTVEQWIFFVLTCMKTESWSKLLAKKGEYNIDMRDLNEHFVIPWTQGTGCSIAFLMNPDPQPAELMISHAWDGSVVETYNALQYVVNHCRIPSSAFVFFCTFCLYQPEDGVGLSISQQISMKPFAAIIESKPKHGMYVIHTTKYEVYKRMWTAHEVDEGLIAGIEMHGAFDLYRWNMEKLQEVVTIQTQLGQCRPDDKAMLEELILKRGGFLRLDDEIKRFREKMINEYETVLKSIVHKESEHEAAATWSKYTDSGAYDWNTGDNKEFCNDTGDLDWLEYAVTWNFGASWMTSMKHVKDSLKADCDIKGAYPSGFSSYPCGPPVYRMKSVGISKNRRQREEIEKSWDRWQGYFPNRSSEVQAMASRARDCFEPLDGDTDESD